MIPSHPPPQVEWSFTKANPSILQWDIRDRQSSLHYFKFKWRFYVQTGCLQNAQDDQRGGEHKANERGRTFERAESCTLPFVSRSSHDHLIYIHHGCIMDSLTLIAYWMSLLRTGFCVYTYILIFIYSSIMPQSNVFLDLSTGGDLFTYITTRDSGRMKEGEARYCGFQLMMGLKYLHERHVSHRGMVLLFLLFTVS